MAGKPHSKNGSRGAASPTPGLNPLDEEREASMADEGGATGAGMESENADEVPPLFRDLNNESSIETAFQRAVKQAVIERRERDAALVLAGFAVGAAAAIGGFFAFSRFQRK